MKKKLLSILAALSLVLGLGLVAAPGASAAGGCGASSKVYASGYWAATFQLCTIHNGNYAQGYYTFTLAPGTVAMTPASLRITYYSNTQQIFQLIAPVKSSSYVNTVSVPAGSYFQMKIEAFGGTYFSPTVKI